MVPLWVASQTCSGGTISPLAKTWISNFLSVSCATRCDIASMVPWTVSRLFGQLVASRQRTGAPVCASAGLASAVAATPAAAAEKRTPFHVDSPC